MSKKIQCPHCGYKLVVDFKSKEHSNMENVKITCPICNVSSPYSSYKKLDETECVNKDGTNLNGNKDKTKYKAEDPETDYLNTVPNVNLGYAPVIGELKIGSNANTIKLKEGRNVIGRKASSSKANIQILHKTEKSRISREHLVINVKKMKSGNCYVHALTLYKDCVNDTFYNDILLKYGDSYFLKNNDIIKLPDDVIVEFVVADDELTLKWT